MVRCCSRVSILSCIMNTSQDIDYKNNLFEHPELTRIVGEPITATLITLQAEVRDNAQSVQSDLGGGANGHLGLVCTPTTYQSLVPNAPVYTRPTNPGRLVLRDGLTQYQIAQARDQHQETTRVFREVLGVERTIIQQIVVAVEPKFLRALRTPGTNKLNRTIPQILQHLFDTYGDVTPSDLRELTSRVENLSFPSTEPVDTIFSEIEDLAAIADIAGAPLSATQRVNMAYIHFQKALHYKSALKSWDEKSFVEQTWPAFKRHFRDAHKALRRTGALTINDTINKDQLMNMVTEGVMNILQDFTPTPATDEAAITPSYTDDDSSSNPPSLMSATVAPSVNSTVSDLTVQTMQKQMEMLQSMMAQMQNLHDATASNTQSRRNNHTSTRSNNTFNPNQQKYCWTHGFCNHHSPDCRSKADGHRDEATRDTRLGGSARNMRNNT